MPAELPDRGSVTGFAAGLMALLVTGVVIVMMTAGLAVDYLRLAQSAENLAVAAAQLALEGGDACTVLTAIPDSDCRADAESVTVGLAQSTPVGPLRTLLHARAAVGFAAGGE